MQNHKRPLVLAGLATVVIMSMLGTHPSGAAPASATSLFGQSKPKVTAERSDSEAVELGVKWRSDTPGTVTGIRFFKGSSNSGPHTATLWDAGGKRLATASFAGESASGWQTARLDKPVDIKAFRVYVASYLAPRGNYAADSGYFNKTYKKGNLTVPKRGGVYRYGGGFPTASFKSTNYWVDVMFTPGSTIAPSTRLPTSTAGSPDVASAPADSPTATTTTTTAAVAQPQPGTSKTCASTEHVPGGADGSGGCWPGPSNTGVPPGTHLSPYTGPCTIVNPNTVIDAKTLDCSLLIRAAGVKISRSMINGTVATEEESSGYSFSISDSTVSVGNGPGTGVGAVNFTATRVHVTGGNRSMHCFKNCVITDSYVHQQFKDMSGKNHESGIRMGEKATLRHNTIACDAPDVPPDAGCSAALTGYGDFAVVQNNTIDRNLFLESTGGFCAYGGSSKNKPFSDGTNNIVFTNNVFQRGKGSAGCGSFGAITSFDSQAPGNAWKNNTWDDGSPLAPAN